MQAPQDKKTILVVDDDTDILEVLKYRLRANHYAVLTADNGRKGLNLAAREKPHLVLLDINMPGLNGFEVCRKLKSDPVTKDIPVIVLTSKNKDADLSRALQEGAFCFLTKPWNSNDLLAEISGALN